LFRKQFLRTIEFYVVERLHCGLCSWIKARSTQVMVAPVSVGQRAAFQHALTAGLTAQEYEPQGKAAEEVTQLYMWTCEQVGMRTREQKTKPKRRTA
jgi:hypothetical protein